MTIPPVFYSLKFWQSVTVLIAAVAVQFGWLPLEDAGKLLVVILGILNLFDIIPELRAKGRIQ
jgi:hypothetical protein